MFTGSIIRLLIRIKRDLIGKFRRWSMNSNRFSIRQEPRFVIPQELIVNGVEGNIFLGRRRLYIRRGKLRINLLGIFYCRR